MTSRPSTSRIAGASGADVERSLKQYEMVKVMAQALSWEEMAPSLERALKHFFRVEAWVDRMLHTTVDMNLGTSLRFRYANGWWTIPEKRAYLAVGFLRQIIVVLPDADLVAVVTGKSNYPLLPLIDRVATLAASTSPTALPADASGSARLAERVAAAAIEKATPVAAASALAPAVSGRTWRFDRNALGIRSLRLDLVGAEPRYRVELDDARRGGASMQPVAGPIGLDGLTRSTDVGGGDVLAVKGRWLAEDTFEIVSHSVGEGVVTRARLVFRDREVDATFSVNNGLVQRVHGERAE